MLVASTLGNLVHAEAAVTILAVGAGAAADRQVPASAPNPLVTERVIVERRAVIVAEGVVITLAITSQVLVPVDAVARMIQNDVIDVVAAGYHAHAFPLVTRIGRLVIQPDHAGIVHVIVRIIGTRSGGIHQIARRNLGPVLTVR